MPNKIQRGKYERIAISLIWSSLIVSIGIIVLFLMRRPLDSELAIDTEIFGQFGDIIGGLVGTIIALVSFLLLYETLNEQRRQFQHQIEETRGQLKEQKEQFRKQNENQLFYQLIDRLQNHVHNMKVSDQSGAKEGYDVFKFIATRISDKFNDILFGIGKHQMLTNFDLVERNVMATIIKNQYGSIDENNEAEFQLRKSDLKNRISHYPVAQRWSQIFNTIPTPLLTDTLRKEAIRLGTNSYGSKSNSEIKKDLRSTFKQAVQPHYHTIEGYINEVQFLSEQIDSFARGDQPFYVRYFNAQMTSDQKKVMYFCLLCEKISKGFWLFTANAHTFADIEFLISDPKIFNDIFHELFQCPLSPGSRT